MQATELVSSQKAGIIPYVLNDDGIPVMYFMVPSDPAYGGTAPQIAKGNIDPGENARQAAMREGNEELGLIASNVTSIVSLPPYNIPGTFVTATMYVFVAKVASAEIFGKPHFETGATHWLTLEEFRSVGRASHIALVTAAYALMK